MGADDPLFDANVSDDIIFGGLGDDFLHGASGDDAMGGGEALDGVLQRAGLRAGHSLTSNSCAWRSKEWCGPISAGRGTLATSSKFGDDFDDVERHPKREAQSAPRRVLPVRRVRPAAGDPVPR